MLKVILLATLSSGVILAGCATTKPFDSEPSSFPSASVLAKREVAQQAECNAHGATPLDLFPTPVPPKAIRSGYVSFKFDLTDAGQLENVEILTATEEIFVKPLIKSLDSWRYAAKRPEDSDMTRKNICSNMTFTLREKKCGERIPTWTDVEEQNLTYQKYKNFKNQSFPGCLVVD